MEAPATLSRRKRSLLERKERQLKHRAQCASLGQEDASVRQLEELLFGAEEQLTARLEQDSSSFLEDDDGDEDADRHSVSLEDSEGPRGHQKAKRAVWEDEDDELDEEIDMTHRFRKDFKKSEAESKMKKQKLQQRLKEQFQKAMGGTPSWAEESEKTSRKKDDDDDDESEDLLRRTGNFISSSDSLPKRMIKMKRCLNANNACPSKAPLTSVQFHRSAQIVMTAGLDHSLSLFQVDGKTNPKIQSIILENFPVQKAAFSADGEQIVATGVKNKLFYVYDMMEGKVIPVTRVQGLSENKVSDFQVSPDGKFLLLSGSSGYLHLITTKTREVVRSMKLNGSVCSAAFTSDSSKIFSSSQEGEVFIWDVRSSQCLKKFTDEGSVRGTSMCLSGDGLYLACGSQSGVVNIYSQKDCLDAAEPKPLKAVMNLVTTATSLSFNHTSEILAIASRADDEATRLVHLPSFTVFNNFPQFRNKTIYRTCALDFSPRSGFYSVANNKGEALLFRLLHYTDF